MDTFEYQYAGICHSAVGAPVGFKLRRKDGGEFAVILRVRDAQQLCTDLSEQIRISKSPSE